MDNIDVEKMILEVHKRPELWDPSSDIYKDKNKKREAWIQLCSSLCEDFDKLPSEKQVLMEKAVISKWRTVRDGYVKGKKREKELLKSGPGKKPCHKYVYADLLGFLDKCVQFRETEESPSILSICTHSVGTDEKIASWQPSSPLVPQPVSPVVPQSSSPVVPQLPSPFVPQSSSPRPRPRPPFVSKPSPPVVSRPSTVSRRRFTRKRKAVTEIEKELSNYIRKSAKIMRSRQNSNESDDEDWLFFKAMLPTVKHLDHYQKFYFRMQLMSCLQMLTTNPSVVHHQAPRTAFQQPPGFNRSMSFNQRPSTSSKRLNHPFSTLRPHQPSFASPLHVEIPLLNQFSRQPQKSPPMSIRSNPLSVTTDSSDSSLSNKDFYDIDFDDSANF